MLPSRPDAERVRLPPLVEVARTRRARSAPLSTSRSPAATRSSSSWPSRAPASPDSSHDVAVELARGVPVDAHGRAAAGEIPDTRGDDPFGSRDPRHLPQPGDGIGHEVHDELRQSCVERVVLERQALGRRRSTIDAGSRVAGRHHERLRRIDSGDAIRAYPGDELRGERSGAAAHVDDASDLRRRRRGLRSWCERRRRTVP